MTTSANTKAYLKPLRYIGLPLLLLLLWNFDWESGSHILRQTNPLWILTAGLCNFAFILLKAIRWFSLLRIQDIHYPLGQTLKVYQAGSFFSVITPGRVGDVVKIAFLKRDLGVLHRYGLVSIFFDRLLDLVTLALSAVLFLCLEKLPDTLVTAVLFFCFLLIIATIFTFSRPFFVFALRLSQYLPLLGGLIKAKADEAIEWYESFRSVLGPKMAIPFLLSCIAYLTLFLGGYALAIGQGLPLTLVQCGYCIAFANIVALLPFSVAGIGTRDLAMIFLFAELGLVKEQAILFSLGYLFTNLLFANTLGGYFWFSGCNLKREERENIISSGEAQP